MRIKSLTPHAKQQLRERFDLHKLPDGKRELVLKQSTNKGIYKIDKVYFVWSKASHKIITFLTEEMVKNMGIKI